MSGRTERKMAWPLEPGIAPKINELVAGLVEEIDAVQPGSGGQIILVELGGDDAVEFLRLAERLTAAWEARGHDALVVDAHPAEPYTAACYDDSPEGLTEIFHYGLSPEAAVRHRDGCSGLWIPAGGKWNLPLESPDEPQLTLFRMTSLADKVILLADRNDSEGFLEGFRDPAHYRLILVSPDEDTDLPELPTAEPIVTAPTEEAAEGAAAEEAVSESSPTQGSKIAKTPVPLVGDEETRGRRRWLFLLLLLLLLPLAWYFALGPGRTTRGEQSAEGFAASDSGFSHLPPPVESPYSAGAREEADQTDESREPAAVVKEGPPRLGEGNYLPDEPVADESPAKEPVSDPTPIVVETSPDPAPAIARATSSPRRRFESRELWRRARAHEGAFYVHVESYRDSVLAASSARNRGFAAAGFALRRQPVRGEIYYRLLVGPFSALAPATAYRDSLLDHTEENYCTIAVEANE
jgi:hypothetical protein